jgi:hypothetical protein
VLHERSVKKQTASTEHAKETVTNTNSLTFPVLRETAILPILSRVCNVVVERDEQLGRKLQVVEQNL